MCTSVCVCACCMRLVPCPVPSRPLTSSSLASICTYSSLEPIASGPQAALRHARHARRQRRFARRDGEVAIIGQHIALPITSKTCPGIPPLHPQHPQVIIFFCFISRSFVVLTLLLGLNILKYIYAANPCSISRSHTVCCPPISMSYSTTSRRAMPTNWISRRATR